MKQLTQKLGSGEMVVQEVPLPQLSRGMIIVRNQFSIISGGTEGSTVVAARKSLIGKARERPQQVKQVIDTLVSQGVLQTYRAVTKKLDAYSPLGYSSAGVVIEVGDGVSDFQVGDLAACAGAGYANHAEVVAVPVNLAVKLAEDADLRSAAYNTLGAISMQGIRQADLRVGESCVVIGLGLLGQLACLILKASGVHVIGVDVSVAAVGHVRKWGMADCAYTRSETGIVDQILRETGGHGADAVLITAATDSHDPINFAGAVSRKKGRVVVVGAVPTGFDRDPHWYRKELELRMACSYGPGRYDSSYEEKGLDYPLPYVRWTEKRNMEAFQRLIERRAISMEGLTTHEFAIDEAPAAFDIIANRSEPFVGIAIRYEDRPHVRGQRRSVKDQSPRSEVAVGISFVGAGSYAQSHLLPNIPDRPDVLRVGVLSSTGTTSKRVAEKFGFSFCTDDEAAILADPTNTVFIATRHDSHASYVEKAIGADKHIFVEKPLCLSLSELERISALRQSTDKVLMVGFNRRFAPLVQSLKRVVGSGPMSMIYRVNAGAIPVDSWIQDPQVGGGRVVGEVCHFVDLLTYINGSLPVSVTANALPDAQGLNDTVNINLAFGNGSVGVIAYYANGAKGMPKEYVEVFSSGTSVVLDDFRSLTIFGSRGSKRKKLWGQNKGQQAMVSAFVGAVSSGAGSPIDFSEIYAVTKACFCVMESVRNGGKLVRVND